MISAFVTEAIGDSISLPVKLLLRTTYGYAQEANPDACDQAVLMFPGKH
jgi:hypothetical protein